MKYKKTLIFLSLTIGVTALAAYHSDNFTNTHKLELKMRKMVGLLPDYIDTNAEYIINPNLPYLNYIERLGVKKDPTLSKNVVHESEIYNYKIPLEWATWQDSAGGRLSRDPNWFIEPAEKYKTKEVPFDWEAVKGMSVLDKRYHYFKHLCDTEASSYATVELIEDLKNEIRNGKYSLFTIRKNEHPVKNMDQLIQNLPEHTRYRKEENENNVINEILTRAQQNPYSFYQPGYYQFTEGQIKNFFLSSVTEKEALQYKKIPNYGPSSTTFREFMDQEGDIYRIEFDADKKEFLPVKKVNKSEAEFYTIFREIERPDMKKLGITGREDIIVRTSDKKLIRYYKGFSMPAYLDSMRASNFTIPIDWRSAGGCSKNEFNNHRMLENLGTIN